MILIFVSQFHEFLLTWFIDFTRMKKILIIFIFCFPAGFFSVFAAIEFKFSGKYYQFEANEKKGNLVVKSIDGETIFLLKKYVDEFIEGNRKDTSRQNIIKFKLVSSSQTEKLSQVVLKYSSLAADILLTCELKNESPEIIFSVLTTYKKQVSILREAFLIDFEVPVSEVYRKNRMLHKEDFQDEYWLDKEGAKFGTGKRSAFIYHVPKISSLQLNTIAKELIVNLDYYRDHRFLHFPHVEGKVNVKEDLSPAFYKPGEKRTNSFSVFTGIEVPELPRLMLNPNGFLSAYIFTEHADWTDIRTHRAVYFGSEDITEAGKATGGFVKNKIPVTKSVFYANPDHVLNSQSTHQNIFTTPIASVKETEGFFDFLKQLNDRGYDICLHTPDQLTSERPLLDEAISFMKKNFNTVSWIDHGYNNGAKNNREAFVCDGLNKDSRSFAKDIWEKYGTKYFWNTYHEDYAPDDSLLLFNSSQIIPYIGFGDCIPTPNYWQHPTKTADFYSWCTRDMLEMADVGLWNYLFSPERLNDFAYNRTVKFNHCYPAGGVVDKGFWKINDQKKIVVEPEFEKVLERLATYRDSGLINLSTVRDLMNYWIDCEKIKFDYNSDGKIKITNLNDHTIKGLSLAAKANAVSVEGKTPIQKKDGGDLIFWFDLNAGESVILHLSKQE